MAAGRFLNPAEEAALVRTIGQMEENTTGEIRVHLAHRLSNHGVTADARATFTKLNMQETADRNGVLIYVVPEHRQLAIIGDTGIHAKVGEETWKSMVETITAHFKKGDFLIGLKWAVETTGEHLARHFPGGKKPNPNELPDEISES